MDTSASRAELARIVVAHVGLHSAMAGVRMAAPLFALEHGHGKAAAGVLVALFAAVQVFLLLPAGRYVDRHGYLRPMAFSLLALCSGAILAAAEPTYATLCVSAVLCGGGVATATIAMQRHVGRMARSPAELRHVFAWTGLAPAVANFIGPVTAGLVIDDAGYRTAFAVLALAPMLSWLLARGVMETPREDPPPEARTPAWHLLCEPAVRRLLIMNWLMNACWDLHGFMVPLLGYERGLSASAIGGILGAFAFAASIARLLLPVAARVAREWVLISGAIAIAGMAFLAYPFTRSAVGMALASTIIGVALGGVQPVVMTVLHHLTPKHRHGEALALRLILVNLSSLCMPLLFGTLGAVVGASGIFWAMGTIAAIGSGLGVRLRNPTQKE